MVSSNNYSEEGLIEAIRNDNHEGLSQLYKNNFPMILKFVLTNNGNEHDAKDVYQEAIIVLVNNIRNDEIKLECKLKTYIYSVCRRLWLSELRSRRNFNENVNDNFDYIQIDNNVIESIIENEKRFTVMDESLNKLGEPCKTILSDFYLNDSSMQDITEKMGYTNTDNAKNQKYKCLQRLKKIFFTLYNK